MNSYSEKVKRKSKVTSAEIQKDIDDLLKEISEIKEEIYKLYEKNSKYKSNQQVSPTSKLDFFNHFIDIVRNENVITIFFLLDGERKYGFNLIKTNKGVWNLEKSFLPNSIDLRNLKQQLQEINLNKVYSYIEDFQRNILAFADREYQVNKLRQNLSPHLLLYNSLSYSEVHLSFKIRNRKTKNLFLCEIILKYDFYSILPHIVTFHVHRNIDDDLTKFLKTICKNLEEQELHLVLLEIQNPIFDFFIHN